MPGYDYDNNNQKLPNKAKSANFDLLFPSSNPTIPKSNVGANTNDNLSPNPKPSQTEDCMKLIMNTINNPDVRYAPNTGQIQFTEYGEQLMQNIGKIRNIGCINNEEPTESESEESEEIGFVPEKVSLPKRPSVHKSAKVDNPPVSTPTNPYYGLENGSYSSAITAPLNHTKEPTNAQQPGHVKHIDLQRLRNGIARKFSQQNHTVIPNLGLSLCHFQSYIRRHPNLPCESLILGFSNYIINTDGTLRQPSRDIVIDYLSKNIAECNIANKNNPLIQSKVMEWIESLKDFFRWTSSEGIYINIAENISYQEIRNKANSVYNEILQQSSEEKVLEGQSIDFRWLDIYLSDVKEQKGKELDQVSIAKLRKFMNYLEEKENTRPTSQDIINFLLEDKELVSENTIQVYLATFSNFFQWTANRNKRYINIYYPNIKSYCLTYKEIKNLIDNRIATDKANMEKALEDAALDPKYLSTFLEDEEAAQIFNISKNAPTIINSFQEFLMEMEITKPLTLDILNFFGKYKDTINKFYIQYALPSISKFFQWASTHSDEQGKIIYPDIGPIIPTYDQIKIFTEKVRNENEAAIGAVDIDMSCFNKFANAVKKPKSDERDEQTKNIIMDLKKYLVKENIKKPQYQDLIDFIVQQKTVKTANSLYQYQIALKRFFMWTSIKTNDEGKMYYPNIANNMPTKPQLKEIVDNERAKQK